MSQKWVYGFDEIEAAEKNMGGDWDAVRGLLGGKGANLGEMTRIGVPVPPGFTVTTQACNAFLAAGDKFPTEMWDQVLEALKAVEQKTRKKFGSTERPLLLSCRSGAKFSMPGMMDTVLNIGLNDDVIGSLIDLTEDAHFVYDSYRRLIQMFGAVVLGIRDEPFEDVLLHCREARGVTSDTDLPVEDLQDVVREFKAIVRRYAKIDFPADPYEQLRLATEAVFKSWNGKRARDYRNAAHIAHDLGTGVNVQTMVFGNMGEGSATGVAMSRNATTGEKCLEGDFLINAQGEDVVAGNRPTEPISTLQKEMPKLYEEFQTIANRLEQHYREMQDMEFTIEHSKLWLLQTRDGKRTAQAAVRIAVDMVEEGLIDKEEAIGRVNPDQVDFFLHPQFSPDGKRDAKLLTKALNVSPGAAVGVLAFTADLAERWAKEEGRSVIMVRPETKPDDVHGMLAAEGILTSSGGRTSHAALVARQFGKPAVVGASDLDVDVGSRIMTIGEREIHEGDWVSIDGTTGEVFLGQLDTLVPNIQDPYLMKLLGWADECRTLGIWANADYPVDAKRAREYGAEGIGLCRTEHMFFEQDRLPIVQRMITTQSRGEQREAVDALLPFQRADFAGLFRVMDGLPVIIRLIDPPLHEFLPGFEELTHDLADLKIQLSHATNLKEVDELLAQVSEKSTMLDRVEALREANPMLGTRGVRLGILMPALTRMQVRAIFEAACEVTREGVEVHPEVMIPLTCHVNELKRQRQVLEAEARAVMDEQGLEISYKFGTMIEIPRAALTADEIAEYAQFLSFGTNDLTQTTFGVSRDDAESSFLINYLSEGILPSNPFATIDAGGVGKLMRSAVTSSREIRPEIEVGVCGEHGGDPKSIAFFNTLGLNYVSCSPFRVPVARLAAAQAAIAQRTN
ncbi:MAG: pyruvate, phosphate dikinase [Deltaproteobacteria bacterium]|nr:pyruvate, phosphate dikinase [Deltaproteobacteria bacterium]